MNFSAPITPFMQLPQRQFLSGNELLFAEFFNGVEFFSSGRDALLRALKLSVCEKSKIFIPNYFCPWIIKSVRALYPQKIVLYSDIPSQNAPDFSSLTANANDVVIAVNFFGTRNMQVWADWKRANSGVILFGDFSHCPFANQVRDDIFDYSFASLRKTLPLCDGGYLWSKNSKPNQMFANHGEVSEFASNYALAAMLADVDYRKAEDFYYNAEMRLNAKRNISRISFYSKQALQSLDFHLLWEARKRVFVAFENALIKNNAYRLLKNEAIFNSDKFSIFCPTLYFDNVALRDFAYARLGEVGGLASVYWSAKFLETAEAKAEASKMMTISVDFRHSEADAIKLAEILNKI